MFSMSLMGLAIGFAVIYVSSLIRYEELKRELSVLMLLGLNSKNAWMYCRQDNGGGLVILGIPLSYLASRLISATMSCDMYTIPKCWMQMRCSLRQASPHAPRFWVRGTAPEA